MKIGVPTEIKEMEHRVALLPGSVAELVDAGHEVVVQAGAGAGVGCSDDTYRAAGANIAPHADALFAAAELIVKVKEPQPSECGRFRPGQILFTYLHLAAAPALAAALQRSGVTAIAYETVVGRDGGLPLLQPMSEIAGCMSVQVGATCLHKSVGGRGRLLGGVAGVRPASVVILGGGVAGSSAIAMAVGLGARVAVCDISVPRLRSLASIYGNRIETVYATRSNVEVLVADADLVVGAVLVPGGGAPKLVSREMLGTMRPGSVLVDIAIDQGGCSETSRATTHSSPTFVEDGIVHYCVANMPGAVPLSSSEALANVTLPYVKAIADSGWERAFEDVPGFADGLNVHAGKICHPVVAEAVG